MSEKNFIDKSKQKLFYIQWHDAFSYDGWLTDEELKEYINKPFYIVEEVGWIVYEDSREICFVSRRGTWDSEGADSQYGLFQRIPKTWILKKQQINIK